MACAITVEKAQGLQQIPATLHGLLKIPDGTAYQFTSTITTGYAARQGVPATPGGGTAAGAGTGISRRIDFESDAVRVSGALYQGAVAGAVLGS